MFDEMPLEEDTAAQAEQFMFKAPVASMGIAHNLFDEMLPLNVVWDEELLHDLESHDGLLEQLARSEEYLVDEERKPITELDIDYKLTHVSDAP